MRLEQLLAPLMLKKVVGERNVEITSLAIDSRRVQPGSLFIALRGTQVDGHQFIAQAMANGASALLVEQPVEAEIPVIIVPDTRRAMAVLAAHFYQYPTEKLRLIGVTGTNGKTTTTHLIRRLLEDADQETGLIGTIAMEIGNRTYPVINTTPEVIDLQAAFAKMREQNCEYAVIEASSHALDMGRTRGCAFHIAVFTNLTQDHLDYHQSMDAYRQAKGLLFSQLGNHYASQSGQQSFAVLNRDDPASEYFSRITPAQVVTYGLSPEADVRATDVRITAIGTSFTLETFQGSMEIELRLVGKFNVYNALAAAAVALIEGLSLTQIRESLQAVPGVPGRFESVQAGQPFSVIVDYAHTPDSLENTLRTIHEFAQGRIWTIIGCGGDRDRSKRPLMARVAVEQSDYAILTSDNPRTEEPEAILADMQTGLIGLSSSRFTTLVDRREAIQYAVNHMKANDILLIAGKGHETYQEIQGKRYAFDDRLVAKEAIMARGGVSQ